MTYFSPNQLSRERQIARFAHGAPQAQVPQGQARVAVGGYPGGPYGPEGTRGGWGTGAYEMRTSPNAIVNDSGAPNIGPMAPAGVFSGPGNVLRQAVVPICAISQAEPGGLEKCVQCFPDHGRLYPSAAKSGNGFGEILMTRLTSGGTDANRIGTRIDLGLYGSDNMFLPVDLGCVQRDAPISICFRSFSTLSELPYLILCFLGTRDQAWNSCEPGLNIALASSGFANLLGYPQAA